MYVPRRSCKNLTELERFEICLGAFLTQNTNWGNVEWVLKGLKKNNCLNFKALSALSLPKMQTAFRSSGYFRQKSARVRGFLKAVKKESGGNFRKYFDKPLPVLRKQLLDMNGIGPETADSILLYAAGKPIFVVDAYTRRFGQRRGILKGGESYDEIQRIFMRALPRSAVLYREYHALIVKAAKEEKRRGK